MGVGVQCYADVCMTHNVLQCLGVHPRFCHIGTEGVPAHMWRYFRHLNAVDFIIVLDNMLQVLFPMKCHHRHIVLVQKQKTNVSINHGFRFGDRTVGDDPAETGCYLLGHRNIADAAFCLWLLDRKSAEFRDTKPCVKEDIEPVVVSAEMLC